METKVTVKIEAADNMAVNDTAEENTADTAEDNTTDTAKTAGRGIIIRQAVYGDVPGITAVEAASSASPWSEKSLAYDVETNENAYVAVLAVSQLPDDGSCRVIGYADMWMVAGEAQLNNIAVTKECRGRGLGEKLLAHMIDKSRGSGQDIMTLEVRRGNKAALGLYNKLGFTTAGIRPGYYTDNGEDAVLMDLDLADYQQNRKH